MLASHFVILNHLSSYTLLFSYYFILITGLDVQNKQFSLILKPALQLKLFTQ